MSLPAGTSEIFICPGGINIERLHLNFGLGLVSFASGLCICDVRNLLARLRLLAVVQSLMFPPWGSLSHMLTALLAGHLSPLPSIPWRCKTPLDLDRPRLEDGKTELRLLFNYTFG